MNVEKKCNKLLKNVKILAYLIMALSQYFQQIWSFLNHGHEH